MFRPARMTILRIVREAAERFLAFQRSRDLPPKEKNVLSVSSVPLW